MKNLSYKYTHFFIYCLVFTALNPTFANANTVTKTTIVKGIIIDNIAEMPIEGVEIFLENNEKTIVSDQNGVFLLTNMLVGTRYKLRFQKEGFVNKEVILNVENDSKIYAFGQRF
jgi:hypothetical protein